MPVKKEQETGQEIVQESVVLVSPSGHKYELTVSDSGNLNVTYKSGDEQ